jgi:acetyl esterase/lipase
MRAPLEVVARYGALATSLTGRRDGCYAGLLFHGDSRVQYDVATREELSMNASTRGELRRATFAGLIGLAVGVGLSGALAYFFVGPAALPSAPGLKTAGRLPGAAVDDPDAAKRDEQARRKADAFMDGLVEKDAVALASHCGGPFLWGRLDRHRVIDDPAEIRRCFSEELLLGWEPKMYAPQRNWTPAFAPSTFFDRYADHFDAMPRVKERLDAFHLQESDRMIVDEDRGLMIAVRATADGPRVIAVVLGGFQPPRFRMTRDVIYGRKFGTALTLDLVQPKKAGNGAAVLQLMSDTFTSGRALVVNSLFARDQALVDLGYTIAFVTHSSTPRHPIPEIVGDIRRAVRYVRYHASRLDLDPDRIAVMGQSSGGYLALMTGASEDDAQPFPPSYDAVRMLNLPNDPVESVSGKATAIVAYFPITDWMNYGASGKTVFDYPGWRPYLGILDLDDFDDKTHGLTRVSDRAEQLRRLNALSPMNRAGRGFPPTLLIHGGKDANVPAQQSRSLAGTLKAAGADVELVVKPNEGHGWPEGPEDQQTLVAWLNQRLLGKSR